MLQALSQVLENFTTYAFCPSTHPCGERLTYQTTFQILHKFEGHVENHNTAQKKKSALDNIFCGTAVFPVPAQAGFFQHLDGIKS